MKQGLQLCKSVLAIHKDEIVIPFILKRHKLGLEENRPWNKNGSFNMKSCLHSVYLLYRNSILLKYDRSSTNYKEYRHFWINIKMNVLCEEWSRCEKWLPSGNERVTWQGEIFVVTAFFKKHRKRVFTEINIDSFLSLMFVVLLRIQRKNEISFL